MRILYTTTSRVLIADSCFPPFLASSYRLSEAAVRERNRSAGTDNPKNVNIKPGFYQPWQADPPLSGEPARRSRAQKLQ
jgi:hypothetical protein